MSAVVAKSVTLPLKTETPADGALEEQSARKIQYPLQDGEEMHDENVVKLLTLMRIWARIFGLPSQELEPTLKSKIHDMQILMLVPEEVEKRAVELTDEVFQMIHSPGEMLTFLEKENMLERIKSYYQFFTNFADGAIEKLMDHYQQNFEQNRAYEAAVSLLRMEIKQEFGCEHEKEEFTAKMKLLSKHSDWREGVKDDWRVKLELEKKGKSFAELTGTAAKRSSAEEPAAEDGEGWVNIGQKVQEMKESLTCGKDYMGHNAKWWADRLKDVLAPSLVAEMTGIRKRAESDEEDKP